MKRMLVGLMLAGMAGPVTAQGGPPPDIAGNAKGAGRVVVARIATVFAQFETNRFGDQLIVSHAVLDVLETLKGNPAATLNVAVEGGTVGDLTLSVSDLPSLQPDERGVFFLDALTSGEHVPHARGNGILKLNDADQVEGSNLSLDSVRQQVRGAVDPARGGR